MLSERLEAIRRTVLFFASTRHGRSRRQLGENRMRRTLVHAAICLALSMTCWAGSAGCDEADALLVMSLDRAFASPELSGNRAFVLSAGRVLVVAEQQRAEILFADGSARSAGLLTGMPLWTTTESIPEEVARDLGLRLVVTAGGQTVFEATRDQAYELMAHGYFVVEVELRPISELKRPAPGQQVDRKLAAQRPLSEPRVRFIRSVSDSVDPGRIRKTLYFLNYDSELDNYRSRFAARSELRQDVTPYIGDTLAYFITPHGGTVWDQEYVQKLGGPWAGGDTIFVNVIGEKPGRLTSARYIVCAHYDAIGVREPGWDWRTDPAPGADDNGTGVAVVLECARLLSGINLDFGLSFIAFTGEELGLLGSKHYVGGLTPADSIIGVINIDMVGYPGSVPKIQIVYDWKSKWLSDRFEEMAGLLEIDAEVEAVDLSGIQNSDHASFWVEGIPGNMLIEELERDGGSIGGPINPYYHSLGDTLGNVDVAMVAEAARLVVGLLARFSPVPEDTLPDLVMTDGSVEWNWAGRSYRRPVAGEAVIATVRALNVGASMTAAEPYVLDIWRGERDSGVKLRQISGEVEVLAGECLELGTGWTLDKSEYGNLPFTFVLSSYPGVESDTTNNTVTTVLQVMPQAAVLENLHVYPNPVTDPVSASLAFDILHPDGDFDGILEVSVFDILGRQVGYHTLERTHLISEIDIGRNVVDLGDLLDDDSNLAPGLYVCNARLRFIGVEGSITQRTRFAVAR